MTLRPHDSSLLPDSQRNSADEQVLTPTGAAQNAVERLSSAVLERAVKLKAKSAAGRRS
jgi:hypothetical protein